MKKSLKVLSAALLVSSMSLGMVPVHAEENITKNEDVFAVLNSDGTVSEVVVTDHLHSDTGFNNYHDVSELTDVENLKSTDAVNADSQGYVWNSEENDIYYQGNSTKELPLDINITYALDGKELSEQELLGKDGHVTITIHVTNRETEDYVVNGRTYHLATPLITVAGGMFDLDHFSNLALDHGSVESDSSHDIAFGIMMPGMKEGLSEVIDDELMDSLSAYLVDTITIEADVTDYASPAIMLAAASNTDALKDEMVDYDLTSVFDQLDALQDATNQLVTGTKSLYEGAVSLQSGISDAKSGTDTLLEGASTLSDAASQVADGASQLSEGSAALVVGLQTLNANNTTLNQGVSSLSDGVFTLVNTVLASQNLPQVTPENYASVFAGQFDVTDTQIAMARSEIASQIASINGTALSDDELAMLLYYAAVTGDQTFTQSNLTQAAATLQKATIAAAQVQDAAGKAANGANDPSTAALIARIRTYLANNPSEEQVQQAYVSILSAITSNQTVVGTLTSLGLSEDAIPTACESILAYAINHHGMSAVTNTSYIAEALQAYATSLMKSEELVSVVGLDDAAVRAVCVGAASNAIANISDTDMYSALIQQVMANGVDQSTAALVLSYGANYMPYDGTTTPAAYLTSVGVTLTNLQSLNDTLQANYNTDETKQLVNSKLADAFITSVSGNDDLKSMKQLLDGMLSLKSGIAAYTAGAQSALDGAVQLSTGASQLSEGAGQLSQGATKLNDGIATLDEGMSKLSDGSKQLEDGSKTLMDAMQKYNDEGISKLTQNDKISSLQEAADLFDVIKSDGSSYNNYSGISENTEGSVKFVFKVSGAKVEKTATVEETQTTDERTFWQRIKDLF